MKEEKILEMARKLGRFLGHLVVWSFLLSVVMFIVLVLKFFVWLILL